MLFKVGERFYFFDQVAFKVLDITCTSVGNDRSGGEGG